MRFSALGFLSPPISGDYEQGQKAKILHVTSLAIFVGALVFGIQNIVIYPDTPSAIAFFALATISLIGLILNHRQRYQSAAILLGVSVLVVLDYALYEGGANLNDSGIVAFPIFILTTTFYFGRRGLVLSTTLSIASVVLLYYLEINHYARTIYPSTPSRVLGLSVLFAIMALITGVVLETWENHLKGLRKSLEETRQGADELAVLYEITRDLMGRSDLSNLLNMILERAMGFLSTSAGGIFLYKAQTNDLERVVTRGTKGPLAPRLKMGEGMAGRVAQSRQAMIVDDYATWEYRSPQYADISIRAVLQVPMIYSGELIGVLSLGEIGESTRKFTERDLRLLSLLAGHVSSVVHNARLLEETQRRASEFAALYDTANALASTQDLSALLKTIVKRAASLLGTHEAIIYLYEEATQDLVVAAVENAGVPVGRRLALNAGGASAMAARTRQPVRVDDYRTWEFRRTELDPFALTSLARVPILNGGELVGVLGVSEIGETMRKFTDDDMRLLSLFAGQAAGAVHSARLLAQTNERAMELAALYDTARDLGEEQHSPLILQTILERAFGLLHATSGAIYLYDQSARQVVLTVARGDSGIPGTKLDLGEGIAGRVASTFEPLIVDDYQVWEHRSPKFERSSFRAVVQVPMIFGGVLIGVLAVNEIGSSERKYTNSDMRLLSLFAGHAASLVYNARSFEKIQHRAKEFQALYETAHELAAEHDLQKVLETVMDRAVGLLGAMDGAIFLCDQVRGDLERVITKKTVAQVKGPVRLELGEGLAGRVARSRQPMILDDYQTWEHRSRQYDGLPVSALISVPMLFGGDLIGVLNVNEQGPTRRKFTEDDGRLLSLFATQAAGAVHNARLFAQTQGRAREFFALYESTSDLTTMRDLPTLLQTIIERAVGLFSAVGGGLYRCDEERQLVHCVVNHNMPPALAAIVHRYGEGVTGSVAKTGEPLIIKDYQVWAGRIPPFDVEADFSAILSAPMIWQGKVTGVINIHDNASRRRFALGDLELLTLFANHAAIAVENARLLEQVELDRSELQELSSRLLQIQEEERRTLARELHDEIGQALTAVKITVESARGLRQADQRAAALDRATGIVQRALDQTRNLSLNLRPSVLDDLGLIPALRWSLDRQSGLNGWTVHFAADTLRMRPSPVVEITCFRVAQEALTNIARHAHAKHVRLELRSEGLAELELIVQDDGTGFDVASALAHGSRGTSLGLLGMQERSSLARGRVEITSTQGKGTRVRALFPLNGESV